MDNNITEDYCSPEVSSLLEEKGMARGAWLVPTQALAIKWIRLNFGIHISAACYYNPQRLDKIMYEAEISHEGNGYEGLLKNASNRLSVDWTKEPEKYWIFNTPEEAADAALLYTLKHLI